MSAGPVELLTDCASCGLESGRVETYDPLAASCRFGLPLTVGCKLCGEAWRGEVDRPVAGELFEIEAHRCPACLSALPESALDHHACERCGARATLTIERPGADLRDRATLEAQLDAWTVREGYGTREALLVATFKTPSINHLASCIDRRLTLEVLADPFASFGGRRRDDAAPATAPEADTEGARAIDSLPPPPSAPPRAIVYPLVSVIAADGEIHPMERSLVDRFLESEGLAPLADHEFRVHHPSAVAHLVPEHRREAIVQLMCETAAIDGLPDESERRVIRAYAAAWHVPDEKVEFWIWGYENMNTSLTRQLWLKLRRFVLSARWNSEPREDV